MLRRTHRFPKCEKAFLQEIAIVYEIESTLRGYALSQFFQEHFRVGAVL